MEDASLLSMDVENRPPARAESWESNAFFGKTWAPPVYYQTFGFSLSPSDQPSYPNDIVTDTQMRDHQDIDKELDFVDEEEERILRQRTVASFARAQRRSSKSLHSVAALSACSKKQYPSPTLRRASEVRKSRATRTRTGAASRFGSGSTVATQEDTQMREITTQLQLTSLTDSIPHYPDSSSSDTDVSDGYEESDESNVSLATLAAPTFSTTLKPATWSTREMAEGAIHRLTDSLGKMSVKAEGRAARRARPY